MRTLITGAALLFTIALPCGAQAQTADAPARMETAAVVYADLDLDQPTDLRMLNSRLRSAALRVCGDANLVAADQRARHWCVKSAVQDGWDQIAARRAPQYAENRAIAPVTLRPRAQP